jgi:hypothetical protein
MDSAGQPQTATPSQLGDGGKDADEPKKANIRKRTKTGCISKFLSVHRPQEQREALLVVLTPA